MAQLEEEGIIFKPNTEVGKDILGKEIMKKFDAVCLAIGAGHPRDRGSAGGRCEARVRERAAGHAPSAAAAHGHRGGLRSRGANMAMVIRPAAARPANRRKAAPDDEEPASP